MYARYSSHLFLPALLFLLIGCSQETPVVEPQTKNELVAGTWVLESRFVDGAQKPAVQRQMKLVFDAQGTFLALYRGDSSQKWIQAGKGGFAFEPPNLTLYWDAGHVVRLMVPETPTDRLAVHHGQSLAPLKDQEPDEVFVREKPKGPS